MSRGRRPRRGTGPGRRRRRRRVHREPVGRKRQCAFAADASPRPAPTEAFVVSVDQTPDGSILYLVATGGTPSASKQAGNNPALALLAVLGGNPPTHVVVNEMTTVASVWTHAQFLDGATIKGHALGLAHRRR